MNLVNLGKLTASAAFALVCSFSGQAQAQKQPQNPINLEKELAEFNRLMEAEMVKMGIDPAALKKNKQGQLPQPNLPKTGWWTQPNFLPAQTPSIRITTVNKPQKLWDRVNTYCAFPGGLNVKLGEDVILDNSSVYQVLLNKQSECSLDPVLKITPANPSTAQELLEKIKTVAPTVVEYLKGYDLFAPNQHTKIEAVPGVGIRLPLIQAATLTAGIGFAPLMQSPCQALYNDASSTPKQVTDLDGTNFTFISKDADSDKDGLTDGEEIGEPLDYATAQQRATERKINPATLKQKTCYFDVLSDPMKADTDEDFVPDGEEIDEGTNPRNQDTDGDGLSDGGERLWGTDPHSIDSDGDGLLDGNEAKVEGLNPAIYDNYISKTDYLILATKAAICGDFCEYKTIPELAGAIIGGFTPISDLRDVFANAIKGDVVGLTFSAIGLIPAEGDVAKISSIFNRFLAKNANKLDDVVYFAGHLDALTPASRVAILGKIPGAQLTETMEALKTRHGVKDEVMLRFISRKNPKTRLSWLLKQMDDCPKCFVSDVGHLPHKGWFPDGRAGEEFLREGRKGNVPYPPIMPGQKRPYLRVIDDLKPTGRGKDSHIARESKVGNSGRNDVDQVKKDCDMLQNRILDGVEWHFFASAISSSIGASSAVMDAIKACGPKKINYIFHMPGG